MLQSYLANRTQRVRINGIFSEEIPVTSGVPQGSILASLLFLLYMKDLPHNCKNCPPLLCADDAKFISINSSSLLIQLDLSRVIITNYHLTLRNDHIRAACNKAIGVLCLLKRSSPLLTMSVKLNLFKSMIIPVLI